MRVIILDSPDDVAAWAANHVATRIRSNPSGRQFALGLPTGSSPLGMYRRLIEMQREGLVSFRDVVTFNMDEYIGLGHDHPASYHRFMWDNFFSHIDIDPANVHIPDGSAADFEAECRAYERAIEAAGGIDLFVGGVGADGHIAFNEPGSSLTSRTRIKTLTDDTRRANSRFFGGDPSAVPDTAITVGVGTVMAASEVMILASGRGKSQAIMHAVEGGVNHMWTVSCLQLHPKAIIVCDDEATYDLKVGTVRYFKEIESDSFDNRLRRG